jgi:uroporphyrin-III C-methyltransferase
MTTIGRCAATGNAGAGAGRTSRAVRAGTVYLVGAGPGDPRLITVRGLEVLRASDVVVYDRLAHPALVGEAPRTAERVYAGKRPGRHMLTQEQINAVLINRARAGSVVARLKGGDPFVFGRGGEEAESLHAARVPFEIVPGVTSAVAVPAYAGIPVTHRRHASAFAVVTARAGGTRAGLDWTALARMPVVVVMMGLETLADTCGRLIAHGRDSRTPAAVISTGTTGLQRTVVGTLGTIVQRTRTAAVPTPAVLVVGEVVRLRRTLRWFASERNDFGTCFGARRHTQSAIDTGSRHAGGRDRRTQRSIRRAVVDARGADAGT